MHKEQMCRYHNQQECSADSLNLPEDGVFIVPKLPGHPISANECRKKHEQPKEKWRYALVPHDHEQAHKPYVENGQSKHPANHGLVISLSKKFVEDKSSSVKGMENNRKRQRPLQEHKNEVPENFHVPIVGTGGVQKGQEIDMKPEPDHQ